MFHRAPHWRASWRTAGKMPRLRRWRARNSCFPAPSGTACNLQVRIGNVKLNWRWHSGPRRFVSTDPGEMAEWLKAHAWKACLGEPLTWSPIPLSPPFTSTIENLAQPRGISRSIPGLVVIEIDVRSRQTPVFDFLGPELQGALIVTSLIFAARHKAALCSASRSYTRVVFQVGLRNSKAYLRRRGKFPRSFPSAVGRRAIAVEAGTQPDLVSCRAHGDVRTSSPLLLRRRAAFSLCVRNRLPFAAKQKSGGVFFSIERRPKEAEDGKRRYSALPCGSAPCKS